jgi:ABC-type glycerol-3-phosphate transport system substrate-binding protein
VQILKDWDHLRRRKATMNKRIKLTGVMIGLMMLLVACGGGTTEQETGGGPVTLTFWDNQQTESGLSEYQQTAVKEFEKANPNINIKVTTVPYDQYQQRLQLAVEGGNPPDVSTVDQIWNPGFASGGAIVPLDDFISKSDLVKEDNFFSGAWQSATWEDQVWGVPFNVDVWQFTYYNKDLLDQAGVDPQELTTWEGLRRAGAELTGGDKFGVGLFGHKGEDTVVVADSFIYSNGGSVLKEDGSCALDEPEAIEALEYLNDLRQYAPSGILNSSSEDMRELFLNESLATEWWPALEQPTLQDSDLSWDFVVGTAPEGKEPIGTYGGWNLVMYETAPDKEAAWKFIEFLTRPDVNGRVVDLVPANIEAADKFLKENRKHPELILKHLENARPRPLSPQYLELSSIENKMLQEIFSGTPAEQAAKAACNEIENLG